MHVTNTLLEWLKPDSTMNLLESNINLWINEITTRTRSSHGSFPASSKNLTVLEWLGTGRTIHQQGGITIMLHLDTIRNRFVQRYANPSS